MKLHRDLGHGRGQAEPAGVAAFGPATANRALHSRIAWELERPWARSRASPTTPLCSAPPASSSSAASVCAAAPLTPTLLRLGSFQVYRRDGVTLPFGDGDWNPSNLRLRLVCREFTFRLEGQEWADLGSNKLATLR